MYFRFTVFAFGDTFKPSLLINRLNTGLDISSCFDTGCPGELGIIQDYGGLTLNHKNIFSKPYPDIEYENEFIDFFKQNHSLLIESGADDFRLMMDVYCSGQCNFEIFDKLRLAELSRYHVSLPISVYLTRQE